MEIKLNTNIDSIGRIEGSQPKKVQAVASEDVAATFSQSEALDQALRQTPDVRSDVVSNGKQLVGVSSYPPTETIKKIATLLARNLDSEN